MRLGILMWLGGCVISDEPRTLDRDQLVELLADPAVRRAVIEALGETYVEAAELEAYARASELDDVVRTADLVSYVQESDLVDVVRTVDLAAYATDDALDAEVLARSTTTLPADQEDCAAGSFVSGWDATGHATCATPLVEVGCELGVVVGFDSEGEPVCSTTISGAVDATVVNADVVDAGALVVTAGIEATSGLLPIVGAVRVDAGAMPDPISGEERTATNGWIHHTAGPARRGTLVGGVPIATGQPTTIEMSLVFDVNGATPPSMSDQDGQGALLDVTYYVTGGGEMQVIRCAFALLREPSGGRINVEGESCDSALGGTGMDISVIAPTAGDASSSLRVQLTRTLHATSGWHAWQIDYLSAFNGGDWTGTLGPGEGPPP